MTRQIATFYLGEALFGVDIMLIKEIYPYMHLSPIPDAPEHLRGLMNLRGNVATVIDLNVCLNRPAVADITGCRLLILKTDEEFQRLTSDARLGDIRLGDDIIGFVIDRMDDVLAVDDGDILPPPSNLTDMDEDLIHGVVKKAERLVIMLNVTAVIQKISAATSARTLS